MTIKNSQKTASQQKTAQKRTSPKKGEHISVRVQEQLKDQLLAIAIEKDRPLSWVVYKILEQYFDDPSRSDIEVSESNKGNEYDN